MGDQSFNNANRGTFSNTQNALDTNALAYPNEWGLHTGFTKSTDSDGSTVISISGSGATSNVWRSARSPLVPASEMGDFQFSVWVKIADVSAYDSTAIGIFEVFNSSGTRLGYCLAYLTSSLSNRPTLADGIWAKYTIAMTWDAYIGYCTTNGMAASNKANIAYFAIRLALVKNGSISFKKPALWIN